MQSFASMAVCSSHLLQHLKQLEQASRKACSLLVYERQSCTHVHHELCFWVLQIAALFPVTQPPAFPLFIANFCISSTNWLLQIPLVLALQNQKKYHPRWYQQLSSVAEQSQVDHSAIQLYLQL